MRTVIPSQSVLWSSWDLIILVAKLSKLSLILEITEPILKAVNSANFIDPEKVEMLLKTAVAFLNPAKWIASKPWVSQWYSHC